LQCGRFWRSSKLGASRSAQIAVVAIDTPCHASSGYLYFKWLCVVTPADSGRLAASMLAPYRPQPMSRNLFFALDISA